MLIAIKVMLLSLSLNANASIIYDFDIRVSFDGDLTDSQQAIFQQAEDFWEFLIVGYQNELPGPGLDIAASSIDIDGDFGVLGRAGPQLGGWANGYLYATQGIMEFDSADMDRMETAGTLFDVIAHEMAHVIGFGTLWTYNDLLNGDGNYIGEHALAGYRIDINDPTANYVPVEQGGGPGTAGGHWDEPDFGGFSELMTGWLDGNTTIGLATINSFADLGYVINPAFAVSVPEPSTMAVFALALFGLRLRQSKRN